MKILVTGTPGTGKSAVSKILARRFSALLLNEKQFALKNGIGEWDAKEKELLVPVKKLERALAGEISGKKNAVLEGHLLCETKLKVDFAVLLRAKPKVLEAVLGKRGYSAVKVLDNVFAEENAYCKKQLEKRYPEKKVIEVMRGINIKETAHSIISEIKKRSLGKKAFFKGGKKRFRR